MHLLGEVSIPGKETCSFYKRLHFAQFHSDHLLLRLSPSADGELGNATVLYSAARSLSCVSRCCTEAAVFIRAQPQSTRLTRPLVSGSGLMARAAAVDPANLVSYRRAAGLPARYHLPPRSRVLCRFSIASQHSGCLELSRSAFRWLGALVPLINFWPNFASPINPPLISRAD